MAGSLSIPRAEAETGAAHPGPASRRPRHPALVLVGAWVALAAFLAIRQLARDTPLVFTDELIFGRLAQNLGFGDGWTFQGNPSPYHTLAPLLIAPAWAAFEHSTAYHVALAINGIVMTSVVFPAFWIARRVAPWWHALVAAVGAALTPSMVWAGMLMTEALAYPAATLALALALRSLLRPGLRPALAALAAVGLAAAVRSQLVLLGAVYAAALVLFVLVPSGDGLRARLRRHRPALLLVAAVGVLAAVLIAVVGGRDLAGPNAGFVKTFRDLPGIVEWLDASADYVSVLAVTSLGVPVLALIALSLSGRAWRERETAALLALSWTAAVAFILFAAYTTVALSPELRERYIFYATPLLAAAWVGMIGRVRPLVAGAVTVALTLYLIPVLPFLGDLSEDWVTYDLGNVASFLGLPAGWVDAGRHVSLIAVAVATLGAAATLGLARRDGLGLALILLPPILFTLAVLNIREHDAAAQAAAFLAHRNTPPEEPGWIDGAVDGPVAVVATAGSDPYTSWHVQIGNRLADREYRLGLPADNGVGEQCPLAADARGRLSLLGACGGRHQVARYLLFTDDDRPMGLANGRLLAGDDLGARLYEVPAGEAPRLDARSLAAVRASERATAAAGTA
jgi:hypothetical protein